MPPDAIRRGAALAAFAIAAAVVAGALAGLLFDVGASGARAVPVAFAGEALDRLCPGDPGDPSDPASEDDADEQASTRAAEVHAGGSSTGLERSGPRRAALAPAPHDSLLPPPEPRAPRLSSARAAPSLARPRAPAAASPDSPRPPPSPARA